MKRFYAFVKTLPRGKTYAAALLALGFFASLFSVLTPLMVGKAIDLLSLGAGGAAAWRTMLLTLLLVYVLHALSQWGLFTLCNEVGFLVSYTLRRRVAEKVHRLPIGYLDAHAHGDLARLQTGDCDKVQDGIIQGLPKLLQGAFIIVGTLVSMLLTNALIALIVLLLTPLSVLVAKKITLSSHALFHHQAAAMGEMTGFIKEQVQGKEVLKAFDSEDMQRRRFQQKNAVLARHTQKAQLYGALVNPLTRFVNHLVYIAVGAAGGLLALGGWVSVGQVSTMLAYANQYTKPFNEISAVIHQLQAANACFLRVDAFLRAEEEREPEGEAMDAAPDAAMAEKGKVVFDRVSFRYQENKPLIEDFSMAVPQGAKVAVVGKTGAGKTTLMNLLMRFYPLRGGAIYLDGRRMDGMEKHALRRTFAMVLQDSWIFEGTVLDNIAFGSPKATRQEVEDAARRAMADSFIRLLPQGYDTVLDKETQLSEGQKQLLCIARVMLAYPDVLILDEATSAVDTRTEKLVQQAFDRLMQGRTGFIIAHRLSTIVTADIILLMDRGRVLEMGTHRELMAGRGAYYQLFMSQFEGGQGHVVSA